MSPKALFKLKEYQEKLDKNGFVTVPFLTEEELAELKKFKEKNHPDNLFPEKIDGIHMTTWCSDNGYKQKVGSFLHNFYEKPCARTFKNFRTLNDVFITKEPGGGTTFKVHQDWNVVDEKENFAINVWVPLHDVDEKNGALWVLPGSHKIDRHVRGSAYLFPDYSPFFDDLEEAAQSVNLKAGQAIVFYVNIIHGSPPNLSETERVVTCFSVIPEDAPLHIYFQKNAGDQLEVHNPPDDFMYHYKSLRTETLERPPTNNPVKVFPSFVNKPVTLKELNFFLNKGVTRKSWLKNIFIK